MKKKEVRFRLPGIRSRAEKIVVVSIVIFCALIILLGTGKNKVNEASYFIGKCIRPAQILLEKNSTLAEVNLDVLCKIGKTRIRKRPGFSVSSCNDGKGFMVKIENMSLKQCRALKKKFSAYNSEMVWFKKEKKEKEKEICQLCFGFK